MEKRGLLNELRQAGLNDEAGIFFGDEMRVGLIGQVRRVWAPRGVKVVQAVEYRYEWAYLNLALNPLTGTLLWRWTDNMKGVCLAPVLQEWATAGVEALVWDNAPGHKGPAYQDVPVQRLFQPAYSPELNPPERLFEALRARIEGLVYGTLAAKKAAVEAELRAWAADPDRVRQLAAWPWIRETFAQLAA